jgi:hypothetical protein
VSITGHWARQRRITAAADGNAYEAVLALSCVAVLIVAAPHPGHRRVCTVIVRARDDGGSGKLDTTYNQLASSLGMRL